MAESTVKNHPAAGQPVYGTSYAFGNGTTSTVALQIWQALSEHLLHFRTPMTAEELGKPIGLSVDQVDALFHQAYYQRFYGFRRFESVEQWQEWAKSTGVLYSAELHAPPVEDADDDEPEEDE